MGVIPATARLVIPPAPSGLADDDALLTQEEADRLASTIELQWRWGQDYFRPWHQRQDLWMNMYLLLDLMQQSKPLGFRRFISNDPQTAVDAAVSIMTRNDLFWQIDLKEGMTREERAQAGKIERALSGIVDDFDELLTTRNEMTWKRQAAYMALLRGAIFAKYHVTQAAMEMGRPAPFLVDFYDPRFSYPCTDGIGLSYFITEK